MNVVGLLRKPRNYWETRKQISLKNSYDYFKPNPFLKNDLKVVLWKEGHVFQNHEMVGELRGSQKWRFPEGMWKQLIKMGFKLLDKVLGPN